MKKFTKNLSTIAAALLLVVAFGATSHAGSCGGSAQSHADKATQASAKAAAKMDIVETAVSAGNFTTLVAAVKAAGLADVLKGDGPFTVFAPTDEAFAKLPEGTVEELLKDTDALASILTYHVVSAEVLAADVVKLDKAKTVNGEYAMISVGEDGVKIDNANVVKTDIMCSNGVIHVIDAVILPSEDE